MKKVNYNVTILRWYNNIQRCQQGKLRTNCEGNTFIHRQISRTLVRNDFTDIVRITKREKTNN